MGEDVRKFVMDQIGAKNASPLGPIDAMNLTLILYLGPLVLSRVFIDVEEIGSGPLQKVWLKLVTCVVHDNDGTRSDQRRGSGVVHGEHGCVLQHWAKDRKVNNSQQRNTTGWT